MAQPYSRASTGSLSALGSVRPVSHDEIVPCVRFKAHATSVCRKAAFSLHPFKLNICTPNALHFVYQYLIA